MTRGLVEDIVISGLREGMGTRGLVENMVTSSDYISTSEIMLHLINYFLSMKHPLCLLRTGLQVGQEYEQDAKGWP